MKKLCENRKSAPYISLLYHFLLAEAGLLTVVYLGILRQMKDGALPCSWGGFWFLYMLSNESISDAVHHSSLCSSLAAPSLCLVSKAQCLTAKLKIRSLLYCFSPRLAKNIFLLFDGCMSKNTHTHTHTHTQSHSFGGQTQLAGMTKKNYICNHLFKKKKKSTSGVKVVFSAQVICQFKNAFLPAF